LHRSDIVRKAIRPEHYEGMAGVATWICWGVVIVTWIAGALAGRSSPGRHQGDGESVAWRIGAIVVAGLVYRLFRGDLHDATDHSLLLEIPGLVVLIGSTVFTLWARLELGRMWSASPDMLTEGHELRTDGPYAVTRHPIYTGILGMLIGTALLNGLGASLLLLVVGVAVVATRIPIEERLMTKTFPDQYAWYRKRTPRIVPGLQLLRRPQ
jgi:protein-S-isoprenylcysteine O-methyltransferase Ste14